MYKNPFASYQFNLFSHTSCHVDGKLLRLVQRTLIKRRHSWTDTQWYTTPTKFARDIRTKTRVIWMTSCLWDRPYNYTLIHNIASVCKANDQMQVYNEHVQLLEKSKRFSLHDACVLIRDFSLLSIEELLIKEQGCQWRHEITRNDDVKYLCVGM